MADFTSGPGPMLQEILIERREEHDNWVCGIKNTDMYPYIIWAYKVTRLSSAELSSLLLLSWNIIRFSIICMIIKIMEE